MSAEREAIEALAKEPVGLNLCNFNHIDIELLNHWHNEMVPAVAALLAAHDAETAALRARIAELERDAARYRQAVALEDNAESLFAAVLNNANDFPAIDAEFDEYIATQGAKP